jgi:tetratricopeptide (TPR) repeat protein
MFTTPKIILLVLLLATSQHAYCQNDKAKAHAKGEEAIKLEDEGKFEDALKLLNEAQNLDPQDYNYPYEVAYVYMAQKEYKKALKEIKKVTTYKDINDQVYQMLGNVYDVMGDSASALRSYDEGLKLFPKSGKLYLEKGNVYWGCKAYGTALPFYEQGIVVEPKFPSNYYRATRIYCGSSNPVWGMIYGEIFMNLERNSKRTAEISKLLFDTYKEHITFKSKSEMSVSFCHSMVMKINNDPDPKNVKLPFCMIYEPTLLMSIAMEKKIDMKSLDHIRTEFVKQYFQMNNNKTYPNILFDYQNQILQANHLEAYNHWILMKGDEDGFNSWEKHNQDEWNSFLKWFKANEIPLNENHYFYSGQY